ncbi:MAG: hypothetical protein O2983_01475, partial [Planctomycetota bacterium]|nr:hypothetical protein [Planctomycetota bacterium]
LNLLRRRVMNTPAHSAQNQFCQQRVSASTAAVTSPQHPNLNNLKNHNSRLSTSMTYLAIRKTQTRRKNRPTVFGSSVPAVPPFLQNQNTVVA